MERAVIVSRGETITPEDLSERIRGGMPMGLGMPTDVPPAGSDADVAFKDRIKDYETQLILDALKRADGNQTAAAKMLKMPLRTLVHKIKLYGIKKMYE